MTKEQFINELGKLRPSSTFLTVSGYRNDFSEISDFSIVFHINYENALRRSISFLENMATVSALQEQAKIELLRGFNSSLIKTQNTPIEEINDAYSRFFDESGQYIKGVKMHTKTGILHLYGLVVHKRILVPGFYPNKSRTEYKVIKDKLRQTTQVGKFRQFRLLPYQVDSITVNNITLLPPNEK